MNIGEYSPRLSLSKFSPIFTSPSANIIVNYCKITLWVFCNDFSYWPVQYMSSCLVHHHTYPSQIHLALNKKTLTVQDPHIHLSKTHVWHVGRIKASRDNLSLLWHQTCIKLPGNNEQWLHLLAVGNPSANCRLACYQHITNSRPTVLGRPKIDPKHLQVKTVKRHTWP